ncbi:biotin--protein ligase-like [Littorina saxatilis]|uniref:BPL/LPL catalytic domain-containing protein n=1 Tax=Littorina saxatilis TaxID=31220 RepID=A0AAN9GGJ7_9CAEN
MFIILGYVSIALIQLYRQCRRQRHYASVMLRAVRNGSVLVQRGKTAQHGSVGALLNSSLLSCTKSYKETQLLCDEDLAVSVVSPKQKVDLSGWTSYLDLHPAQDGSNSVVALLEAGRPDNLDTFLTSTMQVPLAYQVHVLKHGCPIAWKSGSPFGIILHCSYNDFVLLCDAFGQGHLTLDEDLELYKMLTVTTVGRPRNLKRPSSEALVVSVDQNNSLATVPLTTASSDPLVYAGTNHTSFMSGSNDSVVYSSPERKPRSVSETVTTNVVSSVSTAVSSERGLEFTAIQTQKLNGDASPIRRAADKESSESINSNGVSAREQEVHGRARNGTSSDSQEQGTQGTAGGSFSSSMVSDESLASGMSPQSKAESSEALNKSLQSLSTASRGKSPQHDPASYGSDHDLDVSGKADKTDGNDTQVFFLPESPVVKLSEATETITKSVASSSESLKTQQSSTSSPEKSSPSKSPANGSISANGTHKPKDTNATNSVNGANSANAAGDSSQDKKFSKPPNVVVYCGNKDTARKFELIKTGLEQCINTDAYTVYLLPHEEFISLPWEDNCAALIISHDYLHDNIGKKCVDYLLKGGKVISFGSSMEAEFVVRKEVQKRPSILQFGLEKWKNVSAIQGKYHYVRNKLKKDNSSMDTLVVDSKTGDPLVVQLMLSAKHGNGRAIFSQLFLERDAAEMAADSKTFSSLKQSNAERLQVLRHLLSLLDLDTSVAPPPPLTPCYILAQDQALTKSLLDIIASRMKQGVIKSRSLSLKFVSLKSGSAALKATSDTLPVVNDLAPSSGDKLPMTYFDPQVYWSHLTSSVLGRVVFHTDVIPTTMSIFEGIQFSIPEKLGVIAVAGRQTSGKGRGGNTWLSPEGCAMFTMPLQVPVDSTLGQRVSFLQHIAAFAVVHAIRTMPGYESLDIRLKWPNDIYFGSKMKLGGVLVTSTVMGSTMHAMIGCGVNVSNSQPTICVNDIIQLHNAERGSNLTTLSTSQVLATAVSAMETTLTQFQKKGHLDFCQQYYKYWLHSGAHVRVESEGNAEVEVTGLDDYGFLRVVNSQGQQLSVQPDGNSFDMLRNLIATKRE